jgi:hypothetical protein
MSTAIINFTIALGFIALYLLSLFLFVAALLAVVTIFGWFRRS